MVLALALGLLLGGASVAAYGADDQDQDPIELTVRVPKASIPPPPKTGIAVTNAELGWGINLETRGRTYFGACNFAMAGWPGQDGNAKNATPWEQRGGALYHATAGNVSVVDAKGSAVQFAKRCTDPKGKALQGEPAATFTDHQIRLTKGTGRVDLKTGEGQVAWKGTVTVVFYDGLVYFWLRDPVLSLTKGGAASLRATVGGYGSDRNDASKWVRFPDRSVTLASGKAPVQKDGIKLQPDYKNVALPLVKDQALGTASTNPGAWPAGFVDFQTTTGLGQYWYSTGNNHDYRKPPDPLYISWDAKKSIIKPPPTDPGRTPPTNPSPTNPPPSNTPGDQGGSGGSGQGGGAAGAGATGAAGTGGDGEGDGVGEGEASARSAWDQAVEPVEFNAAGQDLVPAATADRQGRRLAVQVALLTLICTSGLCLVGWRRGWFKAPTKGQSL